MEPIRNEENDKHWLCPSDKFDERLTTCSGCELFSSFKRCSACGCFVPVKALLIDEKCPEGKW